MSLERVGARSSRDAHRVHVVTSAPRSASEWLRSMLAGLRIVCATVPLTPERHERVVLRMSRCRYRRPGREQQFIVVVSPASVRLRRRLVPSCPPTTSAVKLCAERPSRYAVDVRAPLDQLRMTGATRRIDVLVDEIARRRSRLRYSTRRTAATAQIRRVHVGAVLQRSAHVELLFSRALTSGPYAIAAASSTRRRREHRSARRRPRAPHKQRLRPPFAAGRQPRSGMPPRLIPGPPRTPVRFTRRMKAVGER